MDMASITIGMDGFPVTKPTMYTNFYSKYTQSTEEGYKSCAASHKFGGSEAARAGDVTLNTTQQQAAAIQETNANVEEVMSIADELNNLANN